jgi:hypothetical protein
VIVDRLDSGLGIAAKSRASTSQGIDVFAAMKFSSPRRLLHEIAESSYDLILFAWRRIAWEVFLLKDEARIMNSLSGSPAVAILVADHLGTQPEFLEKETELVNAIDYVLVTNQSLGEIYSELFPSKYKGILHDFPSDELISIAHSHGIGNEDRQGLVWIGNSNWGKNLGISDHKGYKSVVLPIMATLGESKVKIYDSNRKLTPFTSVLEALSKCRYLIQASVSEGTGLPLLEAIGTGAIPITTDVGVAREVIPKDLQFLIVDRNPEAFLDCMALLEKSDRQRVSETLQKAYHQYLAKIRVEPVFFSTKQGSRKIDGSWRERLLIKIKWLFRHLKYRGRS